MRITDAQVHIWNDGIAKPAHGGDKTFPASALLREMAEAGVDRAVLVPPSWEAQGDDPCLAAAAAHPDRFAVMTRLAVTGAAHPSLANLLSIPGMRGVRLNINTPEALAALRAGEADWIWPQAERADLPIMLWAPGHPEVAGPIAQRHPGLRLALSHCAIEVGAHGPEAFAKWPELLSLAKFPNISAKTTAAPSWSDEPYPFRDVHDPLRRVFDAFGPSRMFWGTDRTRVSASYRQCVTLFTEELPWLKGNDLEQVMGGAISSWLDWS